MSHYLTKPMFGTPQDHIERIAANWLEAHGGQYGETVMRSLADLIKLEIKRAKDPGRPVPPHGSGPGDPIESQR